MDLTKELLAFTDWLETNPLEPSAQTLWMHLMMIANKSGYPEWFAVANPLLQAKVGISENTLVKHRNYLIQKSRIDYKPQGKQKAGKYQIIGFTSNNEVSREVNPEVSHEAKYAVNHEVKGAALFNYLSSSASSSAYESFYAAHNRIFGFPCNPFQAQMLGKYIDEDGLEEAVIIRALERAGAASTGYNFKFITRILDDYFHSGARTIDQAKAIDDQFEARRLNSSSLQAARTPTKPRKSFAEMAREG
ncbi:DnaD domain protein [Paenibacillus sp. MWE-103]|uniref:DnaD domain protein n=1 Tax=Paenibacillus artemisiicola TaxID=1172618 RepID=A0ABS3WGB9_9BACL|nr:DnaD domain protein [Paenibacillus artemisiicola]